MDSPNAIKKTVLHAVTFGILATGASAKSFAAPP